MLKAAECVTTASALRWLAAAQAAPPGHCSGTAAVMALDAGAAADVEAAATPAAVRVALLLPPPEASRRALCRHHSAAAAAPAVAALQAGTPAGSAGSRRECWARWECMKSRAWDARWLPRHPAASRQRCSAASRLPTAAAGACPGCMTEKFAAQALAESRQSSQQSLKAHQAQTMPGIRSQHQRGSRAGALNQCLNASKLACYRAAH